MEGLRWGLTLVFAVPSALLLPLNWLLFIGWLIEARRGRPGGHSFALPFLGGIAGALACLLCPLPGVWRWAWLPPLLDPSILLLLPALPLHLVRRLAGWRSAFDGGPSQPSREQGQSGSQWQRGS